MWGERWGFQTASSRRTSSTMPDSRAWGTLPWRSAPTMCMRTSEEELPPRTWRSWMRRTFAPMRAEGGAAPEEGAAVEKKDFGPGGGGGGGGGGPGGPPAGHNYISRQFVAGEL